MTDQVTIQAALKDAEKRFSIKGIDTARLDAEILLAHVIQCGRLNLYGKGQVYLSNEQRSEFERLVLRRITFEPVAHLIGDQEFWGLPFNVTPDTLIPRPDTETLVEAVLGEIDHNSNPKILDLGTGSGCILISLLHEFEGAMGVGVDLSDGAITVANVNSERLGVSDRVAFIKSDWFTDVEVPEGGFDIIVSNPPYIPSIDILELMEDVREFEPLSALDGGKDGLGPYRLIVPSAFEKLTKNGLLAVEIGIHQASDVERLFEQAGFKNISIKKDLAGIDRVVFGKKS